MGKHKQMKKGEAKALTISHPNSRKAAALSKQIIKIAARRKTKLESAIRRNLFGEKLIWFRDNLEPCVEYTASMFDQLFQKYLKRFDSELEQIAIKHSIGQRKGGGRQHASREDVIRMTVRRETEEYNSSGLEMVDVLNPKQLKMFREWDGEMGFLNQFKVMRFSRTFLSKWKPLPRNATSNRSRKNSEARGGEVEPRTADVENTMEDVAQVSPLDDSIVLRLSAVQSQPSMDIERNQT